jgi:hypothetical protein
LRDFCGRGGVSVFASCEKSPVIFVIFRNLAETHDRGKKKSAAVAFHANMETKQTALPLRTISHWGRQLAAALCGCTFGLMGATGWNPILTFFAVMLSSAFVALRFASDPIADRLVYDERADVIREGFPAAIGLFFLTWVLPFPGTSTST